MRRVFGTIAIVTALTLGLLAAQLVPVISAPKPAPSAPLPSVTFSSAALTGRPPTINFPPGATRLNGPIRWRDGFDARRDWSRVSGSYTTYPPIPFEMRIEVHTETRSESRIGSVTTATGTFSPAKPERPPR